MIAWDEETKPCESVTCWVLEPLGSWIVELDGYFSACSHRGWVLATCHRTLFHASLSCLETNAASSWFFGFCRAEFLSSSFFKKNIFHMFTITLYENGGNLTIQTSQNFEIVCPLFCKKWLRWRQSSGDWGCTMWKQRPCEIAFYTSFL